MSDSINVPQVPLVTLAPATLNMLTEIASSALEDGDLVIVSSGSVDGDGGGGTFVWNANSAAPVDGGVVFVPMDRDTLASGVAMFTGNGTLTTFSGTLPPYQGIGYNGVQVLAGSTVVATDNIAGTLMGANVTAVFTLVNSVDIISLVGSGITGTINYVTGAWTMSFSTAPANGVVYAATYTYANAPGRWIRQFHGGVDVRWFGAIPDGVTDMVPGWAATDYYCALHGGSVYIPTAFNGNASGWQIKTPMLVKATHTYGDASGNDIELGTRLNVSFVTAQPDFAPGVSIVNPFIFERIDISGNDNVPLAANVLSSGSILTQASFQATFTATNMTVTSVASGTITVGGSVSAAGLTPSALGQCAVVSQTSGTTGGAGVYVLNVSQPTISTAVLATQTLLPTLAGLAKGTVGLNCAQQGLVRDCAFRNSKVSVMLTSAGGHVYLDHVEVQNGLIGVYCQANKGDYAMFDCSFAGNPFAGIVVGLGGMDFRSYRTHYGYGPFGVFQVNDGNAANQSGLGEYYGSSFEGFGEAFEQFLPSSGITRLFLGNINSGVYSVFSLQTTLVPAPATYLFQWLGALREFTCSHNGNWANGSQAVNAIAIAAIGAIAPVGNSDIDLSTFQGSYTIKNKYPGLLYADYSSPRFEQNFQRVTEKMIVSGFCPTPNLLLDPEQIGNYYNLSSGTAISVVALSSISAIASDPSLRLMLEESGLSSNPNAIKFTNAAGAIVATINTNSLAAFSPARSVNFHAWVLCSSPSMNVNLTVGNDGTGTENGKYGRQTTATTLLRFKYEGSTPTDWNGTKAKFLQVSTTSAGTLYVIAPMLSLDALAPYNRNPCPTASGPMAKASFTYTTLPSATQFTAGYIEAYCSNGRKSGEAAGAGTGVVVYTVAGQSTWNVVGTNVPVTI